MAQLTIRLDDDLAEACRRVAADEAKSLNGWVVAVLALATDPDHEPSGLERTRERMRRAGILAEFPRSSRRRPPAPELQEARAAGGRGTPSEELIRRDRDGGR